MWRRGRPHGDLAHGKDRHVGSIFPPHVISVSHLGKSYGSTVAVDDVSLEIQTGEIFGLIGPNGAGKTTTMECVAGLRKSDQGTISVLGLDPRRDASALQQRIGVQHQEAQLQNCFQQLYLYAQNWTLSWNSIKCVLHPAQVPASCKRRICD